MRDRLHPVTAGTEGRSGRRGGWKSTALPGRRPLFPAAAPAAVAQAGEPSPSETGAREANLDGPWLRPRTAENVLSLVSKPAWQQQQSSSFGTALLPFSFHGEGRVRALSPFYRWGDRDLVKGPARGFATLPHMPEEPENRGCSL